MTWPNDLPYDKYAHHAENHREIINDAAEKANTALMERLEYEVRGAWRAGYDYLHVYDRCVTEPLTDDRERFSVGMAVIPSNRAGHPIQLEGYRYSYTYDLQEDADRIRAEVDWSAL